MNKTAPSPYAEHLARAAGTAPTLAKMAQSWALLDAPVAPRYWEILFEEARTVESSVVVEFLRSQGKLSDLNMARNLWDAAARCQHKKIMAAMTASPEFVDLIKNDKVGVLLSVCLDIGFRGQMEKTLSVLLKMKPPQAALDRCLSQVLDRSYEASSSDCWAETWTALVGAGANALTTFRGASFLLPPSPTPEKTTLMTMAKLAGRLTGSGQQYLNALIANCDAAAIVGFTCSRGKRFVPMWCGGEGNMESLVGALEAASKHQAKWWDGDPFQAFPDALRLACTNKDHTLFAKLLEHAKSSEVEVGVPTHAIPAVVDQAYRQSLLASSGEFDDLHDLLNMLAPDKGSKSGPDYSSHIQFWSSSAPLLAPLFAAPDQWKSVCSMISSSLPHDKKPAPEEIQSLVDGLSLHCKVSPVLDASSRPRHRL